MSARKALLIGGSGQVGTATAPALLEAGWDVAIAHRGNASICEGARSVILDRNDDAAVDTALGGGWDVVVDLMSFRMDHAQQLIRNAATIGSVVQLSTAAVYQDDQGLTTMEAADGADGPDLPCPITEDCRTVAPGDTGYADRKRAVEIALLESPLPTTVLRPAAIHGPGSPQPREWYHVRRVLDGREVFVYGFGGHSGFHPASVYNIAEMIRLAAETPGDRIWNAADPGQPDELHIGEAIAAAMGKTIAHVTLPGKPPVGTPWSMPKPFFLSTEKAAKDLGYTPKVTFAEVVGEACEGLVREHRAGTLEPRLNPMFGGEGVGFQLFAGTSRQAFDYAAEDRAIADLAQGTGG